MTMIPRITHHTNGNNTTIWQISVSQVMAVAMRLIVLSLLLISSVVNAAIDVYEFDSPSQEAQYKALIEEFRCPKCQNQNLAGSDSQIAQDLKRKTYEMVIAGQSDQQIREYMYERYGDYISYKPPIRPSTWILWFFPPVFLLLLLAWWLWRNAKRSHKLAVSPATDPKLAAHDINEIKDINDTVNTDSDIQAKSYLSVDEQMQLDELLSQHNITLSSEHLSTGSDKIDDVKAGNDKTTD